MDRDAGGWTYILASARNGTLYTGSARVLVRRIHQHREGEVPGFTRKYGVTRLVWFEPHESIAAAYKREQLIKRWRREWKLALIEKMNPRWRICIPPSPALARRWTPRCDRSSNRFPAECPAKAGLRAGIQSKRNTVAVALGP
jgi:putative endonuclease